MDILIRQLKSNKLSVEPEVVEPNELNEPKENGGVGLVGPSPKII